MTRDFWKEKIEKWKASNINMTEFCKREDLNYWTFRDWKSRLLQPVEPEEMPLVKLEVKSVEKQNEKAIEVYLGDIRLSVPAGFSEPHLWRLVSVLKKGLPC